MAELNNNVWMQVEDNLALGLSCYTAGKPCDTCKELIVRSSVVGLISNSERYRVVCQNCLGDKILKYVW